ncbi:MAG TPA: cytochrome c biogenesis protein CcdA [Spirochaetota bacterium]
MLILIIFAFLAGVVTVMSPCILPILPVVLAGSVDSGKSKPLGIITGFVVSFTLFTLTLSTIVQALHISPDVLRWVAAALVLMFGSILVVPFLKDWFVRLASRLSSRTVRRRPSGAVRQGYVSGVVLGSGLGLVWTPCVGPIMASVISLALSRNVSAGSIFITLAYSAGTALPLFLIMQGGRGLLNRFPFFLNHTEGIQKVFGALMIVTALALFTGADRTFQTWFLQTFPRYGAGISSIDDKDIIKKELKNRSLPSARGSGDPLAMGSGEWINSEPLTLSGLKGKVVLVDIWTYSCINCLRTLPYLKAWNKAYKDKGLVIVGVHSPEFEFEKSAANLRQATVDLGVTWPVVQDNDFRIWRYYDNEYWPSHYLYGRDGTLVESHFGEGGYAETEEKIQELLGVSGAVAANNISSGPSDGISPETYLGYNRGERFSSPERVEKDTLSLYSVPEKLGEDLWALSGKWTIGPEKSRSEAGSALVFSFNAGKVYLVMNPVPGEPTTVKVFLDGKVFTSGEVRNGVLELTGNRLYRLFDSSTMRKGTIRLEFSGKAYVFAFTFG